MEVTMMASFLPNSSIYNLLFKTAVYIVCLHNLLPKVTIPSMLHMYFINLRKCITVCINKCPTCQWGMLSSELVPGCWWGVMGWRGQHIHTGSSGSLLMRFSQPTLFSRLISSNYRHTDALKLSSTQCISPQFNFLGQTNITNWDTDNLVPIKRCSVLCILTKGRW